MSAMTLEQVRDWHRTQASYYVGYHRAAAASHYAMADAIDAHLTAHAQMVERVREVIADMRADPFDMPVTADGWADKLAAAIGDRHE